MNYIIVGLVLFVIGFTFIAVKEFLLVEPKFGQSKNKSSSDYLMKILFLIALFLFLGTISIILGILSLLNEVDDIDLLPAFKSINYVFSPFLVLLGVVLLYENERFFDSLKKSGFKTPLNPSKYKNITMLIGILLLFVGSFLFIEFNL